MTHAVENADRIGKFFTELKFGIFPKNPLLHLPNHFPQTVCKMTTLSASPPSDNVLRFRSSVANCRSKDMPYVYEKVVQSHVKRGLSTDFFFLAVRSVERRRLTPQHRIRAIAQLFEGKEKALRDALVEGLYEATKDIPILFKFRIKMKKGGPLVTSAEQKAYKRGLVDGQKIAHEEVARFIAEKRKGEAALSLAQLSDCS